MTVRISKPAINLREKLSELEKLAELEKPISGGPSLGADSIIRTNAKVIAEDITVNTNGMSAGPITIGDGHTVIIGDEGRWSIV